MKIKLSFLVLLFWSVVNVFGQTRPPQRELLDEVVVTNTLLSSFSTGQKKTTLNDSVLQHNPASISDLLSVNTSIHFNQNGYGMVSSPAFRGTTAQQTAVVWNGININSQLNGQADFNTLLQPTLQQIEIKPGGGSVLYGTSAIGGSIHLESKLNYKAPTKHIIQNNYGSFNTLDTRYQWKQSSANWSFNFGMQRHSSDNDFPIPNSNQVNSNGQFNNQSLALDAAYRFNNKHQLKVFSWLFLGDRNLSVIRPSDTKSAYKNQDLRTLLEWEYQHQNLISTTKFGFLREAFEFTQNIDRPEQFSENSASTFLTRYHLQYRKNNLSLATLIDANLAFAAGDDLQQKRRAILATAILAKYKIQPKWAVEASLRLEASDWYNSPVLYSLGSEYRFSSLYTMKLHTSKNFRIPTFNDLFWGSEANSTLRPETAYQVEWGHHFRLNSFQFSATAFYNHINDMIRWIPKENAIWQPENTDKVRTYGAEVETGFSKKMQNQSVEANFNYAYTVSENRETGFQLRYVPYHKATSSFAYTYQKWVADTQFVYVGEMFTRSNNASNAILNAYTLQHVGLRRNFSIYNQPISLGVRVFNLWDADFQGIENRPMPGRYFQIQFSLIL